MFKYTFSTREKVLIVVLAVIVLALLWYVFIFQGINNQIKAVEADISTAENTVTVDTGKLAQQKNMQSAIERYKAAGARSVEVPTYDNIQNVMTQLNGVLSSTASYSMVFDDIETASDGNYERGVTLTFSCASYADAVNVITNLAHGSYPCRVDECSITDSTRSSRTASSNANSSAGVSVSAHLTYTEKPS